MERGGFHDVVKDRRNSITFCRHDIHKWKDKTCNFEDMRGLALSSVIVRCVFSPFYRVLLAYVYLCISWPFGPIAIQGPFVT